MVLESTYGGRTHEDREMYQDIFLSLGYDYL